MGIHKFMWIQWLILQNWPITTYIVHIVSSLSSGETEVQVRQEFKFWWHKKANIQSSVWATVTKLGIGICSSKGHKYFPCPLCHWMCTFLPHLHICSEWLSYQKANIQNLVCYSDKTWYVGSGRQKYYPYDLQLSPNAHIYYLICTHIHSDLPVTKKASI